MEVLKMEKEKRTCLKRKKYRYYISATILCYPMSSGLKEITCGGVYPQLSWLGVFEQP